MKNSFLGSIIGSALLICPLASAQNEYDPFLDGDLRTGQFYLAGSIGWFANYDVEDGDALGGGDFEYDLEDGQQYSIALGTYLGPARVELEVSAWEGQLTQINPFPLDDDAGDFEYLTLMLNVYGDYPLGGSNLDFYIGGGAGIARIDAGFIFSPPFTTPTTTLSELDDDAYTFTAQGMIGLAYNITPNIAITGGYRARFIGAVNFNTGQNYRSDVIHSLDAGLRISF